MAKHIGSFGTPRGPVDLEFDYFGETIRVHPDASDLRFIGFMEVARGVKVEDAEAVNRAGIAAMGELLDFLRGQVHPEDWDRFLKTAHANRQTVTDLIQTGQGITAAVAAFPTERSNASSDGRSITGKKSKGGKRKRDREVAAIAADMAAATAQTPADRSTKRALVLLQGRPDLMEAVMQAKDARDAARAI